MKIVVTTYSGYKVDERPVTFTLDKKEYTVTEIIDRYYNPAENIFKVKVDDGNVYILGHHTDEDYWELKGYYRA
jgi:hypothetical protein